MRTETNSVLTGYTRNSCDTSHYVRVVKYKDHRRILCNFRNGSLRLEIETGRYAKRKVPLGQRICKMCSLGVIEDEKHFLMDCSFYDDLRFFFDKCEYLNPAFNVLNNLDKFCYILENERVQTFFSKTST